MSKKALVISGGGAKGAWGVGVAKALVKHKNRNYNTVIGTSTGSLMGPLILNDDFINLEKAYTSVTQKDIFNRNPFKKNGDIKGGKAFLGLVDGKETLGESLPLKELIREFFPKSSYKKLKKDRKFYGAAVTNLNTGQVEVKDIYNYKYKDMIDWIWASANTPVFMSTLIKENYAWADGGLKDYAPISYVLENDLADEIDVIIHDTQFLIETDWVQKGSYLELMLRVLNILSSEVGLNDIENAKLKIKTLKSEVKMNVYYMRLAQVKFMGNSLVFDQAKMAHVLKEGYEELVNGTLKPGKYIIGKKGSIKVVA